MTKSNEKPHYLEAYRKGGYILDVRSKKRFPSMGHRYVVEKPIVDKLIEEALAKEKGSEEMYEIRCYKCNKYLGEFYINSTAALLCLKCSSELYRNLSKS